ncbi:MAG: hypothetical protein WAR24_18625 [Candidatus Acidiferrales bacterium]
MVDYAKTLLSASWGIFYDHFRLGLARDIPGLGGANLVTQTFLSFPRLFYGDPSTLTILFASIGLPVPCASSDLSDAQIAAMGLPCSAKFPNGTKQPLYGMDHLNSAVAPGHAPIPANAVVNIRNVREMTGFTPQQFADAASKAVGAAPGLFSYDPFGNLTIGGTAFPTNGIPITVDPKFRTPYTNGFHVGLQREFSSDMATELDYYHKSIDNILGVRDANLAFEARIPGHTNETAPAGSPLTFGYGPWFHGSYDAVTLGFSKRMSKRFTLEANYTWTHEIDNGLHSSFVSDLQTSLGAAFANVNGPTDSLVGTTTRVTDLITGQTNASGPFTASNGNPVPKAGIFYNGPDLDKGPSDLALDHTFLAHGLVQLPWKMNLSSIFRAQSGFHYSASFAANPPDVDGDNHFNGLDFTKGRNHFIAPSFVNMDTRIAKRFDFGERVKVHAYLEFFNLFNRDNPAACCRSFPDAKGKRGCELNSSHYMHRKRSANEFKLTGVLAALSCFCAPLRSEPLYALASGDVARNLQTSAGPDAPQSTREINISLFGRTVHFQISIGALGVAVILTLTILFMVAVFLAAVAYRRRREAEAANRKLEGEIGERKRAEDEVNKLNADLERIVAERTEQLRDATNNWKHFRTPSLTT